MEDLPTPEGPQRRISGPAAPLVSADTILLEHAAMFGLCLTNTARLHELGHATPLRTLYFGSGIVLPEERRISFNDFVLRTSTKRDSMPEVTTMPEVVRHFRHRRPA